MTVRDGLVLGLLMVMVGCVPVDAEESCCVTCEDAGSEGADGSDEDSVGDEDDDGADDEEAPLDELDRCDAGEPGWCASWWQAMARGSVTLQHGEDGVVRARVTSLGQRTCVQGDLPFWAGAGVQDGFVDPGLADEGLVLEPGESLELVPEQDWWCVEDQEPTQAWVGLQTYGERVPELLADRVAPDVDGDGDGVPDREQIMGDGTTAAQHAVWDVLASEAVLTLGKLATNEAGRVQVELTTRNLGRVPGEWSVEDRVPAGWIVSDVSPPAVDVLGSAQTGWMLRWDGRSGSRGGQVLSYTLTRASGVDRVYVELPAARLDGPEQQTTSHPAAIYGLDVNQDGRVDCR